MFNRYRELREKRDNLNQILKREIGLDFTSTLILIFFVFGTVVIFAGYFVGLIKTNDFISAFILWFTAVVILDYTKETHDLKANSDRTLKEIRKQNEHIENQLRIEQEPYLVIKDHIVIAGSDPGRLHIIMFKNIGRGAALNVLATTDPEGKISIIEASNPHSVDLGPGEVNNGWAIDENQVIKGLKEQGVSIEDSVVLGIPDESSLRESEKFKADFYIFLWYQDQLGKKYKTVTKIRHSGAFFKVMENRRENI